MGQIRFRDGMKPMYKYTNLPSRHVRLLSIEPENGGDGRRRSTRGGRGASDRLKLRVSAQCLYSVTSYNALSYVWGDPEDRVDITLMDEGSEEYTMSITRSLGLALSRLRSEGYHGHIWADAICINQGDDTEKSDQVRMMTEIYRRAEHVVVWLGEGDCQAGKGFDMLRDMARLAGHMLNKETSNTKRAARERITAIEAESWAGLWWIFSRPWFRRIWIVQEIVVARSSRFMCGEAIMDGEDLLNAINILVEHQELVNEFLVTGTHQERAWFTATYLINMRRLYHGPRRKRLWDFLTMSGKYDASDPRDKVFALVGLCEDIDNDFIDYKIDAREVFRRTQVWLLFESGVASPSLGFGWSGRYFDDLPSWVCQWRSHGPDERFPLHLLLASSPGPPCLPETVSYVDGVWYLSLEGLIFDCIETEVAWADVPHIDQGSKNRIHDLDFTSPLPSDDLISVANTLRAHRRFMQQCVQLVGRLKHYPTGQSLIEVVWRAYLFDISPEGAVPAPARLGLLFERLYTLFEILEQVHAFDPVKAKSLADKTASRILQVEMLSLVMASILCWSRGMLPRSMWQWIATILTTPFAWTIWQGCLYACLAQLPFEWTRCLKAALQKGCVEDGWSLLTMTFYNRLRDGRSFGTTRGGYAGWFPMTAEKGDVVCFFRYSEVPFVLRRTRTKGTYTLIGDAFVYGLMHGDRHGIAHIVPQQVLIR